MDNLKNDLKSGNLKNVYLLYGDEEYIKNIYAKKIINKVLFGDMKDMNIDIFEGKDINSKKIIDAADTVPFLSEYRIVNVKNSNLFIQGKKDDSDKIANYIKNIPETTILIFVETNVDKKLKIFKEVNLIGRTVLFNTISENDIFKWAKDFFAKNGKKISDSSIIYFIRTIENDMGTIVREADKLIDYCDSDVILNSDIDAICIKSFESGIFDLVKAIGNKNCSEAIKIYLRLISLKESPIMVLSMIARQFKLILQTKYLIEKGYSILDISNVINQKSFIVKELVSQSKNFKKRFLLSALNECLNADIDIKTGVKIDKVMVETLIVKYSS